ncbi:capsule assembly Wzi family protein [Hymenobacter sp. BT18]|uniref:capsule assembly Wzi family protein n=1 Tax=Hymenobacter sp. BT18 TaxID=2835648 RepID=UPI00143E7F3E|nr:capsule assembly Wzi family protein [Hymenobacter sp. BT18]QIX62106.1 capsule assembly Wzi family protein [Hymenobacter sp. BT18]
MKKPLLLLALGTLLARPGTAQTDSTSTAPGTPASGTAPAASPWKIYSDPPAPDRRTERAATRSTTHETGPGLTPAAGYDGRQGSTYVPLDADVYRLIDRYSLKLGADSLHDPHTAVRPYPRAVVARLAERMLRDSAAGLSRADRFNLRYLLRDNWAYTRQDSGLNESRQPILKHFYKRPSDLLAVETPDFTLRINPVLGLQAGRDTDIDGLRYINTRGVQVEGTIDEKLGFYTFLADNQMAVPEYVRQRILRDNIVPHEGYWKRFKDKPGQYDFLSARGYVTYAASKHINVQLGHDRNFIGNGYRSLILSDYAAPYFYLKLNTRIWKFNYQNLFAEMTADKANADTIYQKKYFALHHLSLDVTPNFNIGVFESVVFSRGKGRFELQYLNPIIFYRSVEQQLGSNDNALLGLDFKWNLFHTAQLYGQVMLDEFKISEIRAGKGWWGNKQAFQLGAKYIDAAGIRNLDLQAEFNYIRPFTYQHDDKFRNYQHYDQPLAHPMGANLWEILGVVSYQPLPRLNIVGKAFYSEQGLDRQVNLDFPPYTGYINYGGNVLNSYLTRPGEYGFSVGSGNRSRLFHGDLTATYQVRHNLWLDVTQIVRNRSSAQPTALEGNEAYSALSLRWNIAQRVHEF